MSAEFLTVTETPGRKASGEQIARLGHRYRFAALLSQDKDVLEAACGAGLGLGLLGQVARTVVGGDIDSKILAFAERHYAGCSNIEVRRFDAQALPFAAASFEVVLLFEAIYYLPDPRLFIAEAERVLRPGGVLVICTVNREWEDFNPSPFSVSYYTAVELRQMLSARFSAVDLFGAFPVRQTGLRQRIVSVVKKGAIRLHLMPRTMKGKEALKRIFFGRLSSLPEEIVDDPTTYNAPEPLDLSSGRCRSHKILYAVARR